MSAAQATPLCQTVMNGSQGVFFGLDKGGGGSGLRERAFRNVPIAASGAVVYLCVLCVAGTSIPRATTAVQARKALATYCDKIGPHN